MEDVVLHYQSGAGQEISCLLQRTEKLLGSFPCRPPPPFRPWFPSDHRPPIRPARPAPVISWDPPVSDTAGKQSQQTDAPGCVCPTCLSRPPSETTRGPPEKTGRGDAVFCVSGTPSHLLRSPLCPKPERGVTALSPQEDKHGVAVTDAAAKRSWSVFTRRGVSPRSCQSLSEEFAHVVSVHRLHLRQRAKWVIRGGNYGSARDIEQVWRTLSRCVWSGGLPTCNAHIQRDLMEIWVFCDVLCSEQVGRFLKDELQLSGRIVLSVHQRGHVFSL